MDQAIVGAVVGATIQVVLQPLLSVSVDEIKLVFGFKKELDQLKKSLLMIQDFLCDAEVKQVNDRSVRRWLEQLEDVAFEADAVLGECSYELLRKKLMKENPASNKVFSLLPSGSKTLLFHRRMAHKIDEINKNLDKINKEAKSFGLQGIAMSRDHASSSVGFGLTPTDSHSVEQHIVGRDNDEAKIVEMLLSAPQDGTISVVPILGMGGLGKTTLARKVFHHVSIVSHFEKRIWVCVSTNFDATTISKMILESLSQENVQLILTKEVVLAKIREHLTRKRYLLVLDDVWNENSEEWDDFMSSLFGTSHGSGNCILVTTRRQSVVSLVGTLPAYQPRSLSENDCSSIIKSKGFLREVPVGFEEIGRRIAKKCGGLPLVAKVVGGLLRNKSKEEWQSILMDRLLKVSRDNDTVMNILKLSYDRLPSSTLKKCYAYCSIFPQGYRIQKWEVIHLWMAEGFLQAGQGKDMETVGEEIFNYLLQNSLFQDAEEDEGGNITFCRMHDLVHTLACSISGRTIITENCRLDGLHQVRYLVIKSIGEESLLILKQHAKFLRTIFSEVKIVDMFARFEQLHSLKLMCESITELPDVIGELIHLRLLDISGTSISFLPDSIGKLYHLQTLSPVSKRLTNLPKTLVDLVSLRHLNIYGGIRLPPRMGKLTCLRTLPYYTVRREKGNKIGELGNLKNLKGLLRIQNLERVKDKQEAEQADLLRKSGICGLVFEWGGLREDEINDEYVLDGLQPHPSLESLKICGYKSRNFPSWTMKMAVRDNIVSRGELLDSLTKIELENCQECEEVPMFGNLPHLKFLELSGMSNVLSIGLSFYGFENGSTSSIIQNRSPGEPMTLFPALEKLRLSQMSELCEWAEVEATITVFPCLKSLEIEHCPKLNSLPSRFPCLERLIIRYCAKLKTVPSHLSCLQELEVNEVSSDFGLADVCGRTFRLQSIDIRSMPGLIFLPDDIFAKNQNLRKLKIGRCPELESFPTVKGLTALGDLEIVGCKKLRELALDQSSLLSLEKLHVWDCQGLKSIIPYSLQQGTTATSLSLLIIRDCPRLIDMRIVLFESWCSSLQHLDLVGISKSVSNSITQICCKYRSLQSLGVGGFSDYTSFDSFYQHLSQVLHENRSLRSLYLYGKKNWYCLPGQIQHLASLIHLELHDFGIVALPEWIRNVSSLEWLTIDNCKKLRHLPSMEAMQSLTKLNILSIIDCPLLAERCTTSTTADASELPKISHITTVMINGRRLESSCNHVSIFLNRGSKGNH